MAQEEKLLFPYFLDAKDEKGNPWSIEEYEKRIEEMLKPSMDTDEETKQAKLQIIKQERNEMHKFNQLFAERFKEKASSLADKLLEQLRKYKDQEIIYKQVVEALIEDDFIMKGLGDRFKRPISECLDRNLTLIIEVLKDKDKFTLEQALEECKALFEVIGIQNLDIKARYEFWKY